MGSPLRVGERSGERLPTSLEITRPMITRCQGSTIRNPQAALDAELPSGAAAVFGVRGIQKLKTDPCPG